MKLLRFATNAYRFYCKIVGPVTLGVRAIVRQENQVLLVKLNYDRGWYLPGGGVKKGESFKQAALRELREECGIKANEAKLLHLFFSKNEGKNDHIALFEVTQILEMNPTNTLEIKKSKFFALDNLPHDISPATSRRLQEYQKKLFDSDIW